MFLTHAWIVLPMLLISVPAIAEPVLVFGKSDLPALRDRTTRGESKTTWQAIRARADGYCDPASSSYADPEKIDAPPSGEVRIQVLGHTFGRRLMDWVEDLGFAYQITGDEKYGRHGAAILMAAVRKIPVTDPRLEKSFAGARGDIARGLALGHDWLGEILTLDEEREWADVAAGYVRNILAQAHKEGTWWYPHHNFMGVAVGAAGCLALQLGEHFPDEAARWVDECAALVRTYLDEGFDQQGAGYEGTGYAVYGLTNGTLFAEALRRSGGENLFEHPRLLRVPHFFALSNLPGERTVEARNDANYAGLSAPLFPLLAIRQRNATAQWLWERCGGGTHPLQIVWESDVAAADPADAEPLAEHFEGRGLCVFRTGWEKDDVMLSVEAGPYYQVTHNQADKGSFTLYGLGQRWAIDSGYGNNRQPGGRDQTVAHNCVLVDGVGQAISGAGAGTNGAILDYADGPGFGYCLADATEAYARNNHNQPGAVVKRALRHVLFMRPRDGVPAYAVVLDDIQKDEAEHEYTWMLHTASSMEIETADQAATLTPRSASGGAFVETPIDATGQGSCEWRFSVEQAGEYVLWGRVRAGGSVAGKSDSFVVKVDDGPQIAWHMPGRRDWTWGRVGDGVPATPVTFDLAVGEHVLRFLTREPGAQVDAVALTRDEETTPPVFGEGDVLLESEAGDVKAPMVVLTEQGDAAPPRMLVHLEAAGPVGLSVDGYDGHPRLNATATAVNPRFAAVLLPLPGGMAAPDVRFDSRDDGILVRVEWDGAEDQVAWDYATDGRPTVMRK
jgi:hypothetical protein